VTDSEEVLCHKGDARYKHHGRETYVAEDVQYCDIPLVCDEPVPSSEEPTVPDDNVSVFAYPVMRRLVKRGVWRKVAGALGVQAPRVDESGISEGIPPMNVECVVEPGRAMDYSQDLSTKSSATNPCAMVDDSGTSVGIPPVDVECVVEPRIAMEPGPASHEPTVRVLDLHHGEFEEDFGNNAPIDVECVVEPGAVEPGPALHELTVAATGMHDEEADEDDFASLPSIESCNSQL